MFPAAPISLAERAPAALRALLGGLRPSPGSDPGEMHRELMLAVLRVIVLLYAEGLGVRSPAPAGGAAGGVGAIFERLAGDAARDPGAMERRAGGWARLGAALREVRGGGGLFEEGAAGGRAGGGRGGKRRRGRGGAAAVSDGALHRALAALIVAGEGRVPYGALELEQIGSAYEALLAHTLQRAPGGGLSLQPTEERRRRGSHYTPRALAAEVVEEALRPQFEAMGVDPTPAQIVGLKVWDPAMGAGAFLLAACRALGDRLAAAKRRRGGQQGGEEAGRREGHEKSSLLLPASPPPCESLRPDPTAAGHRGRGAAEGDDEALRARRLVAGRCLHGVELDPIAAELARVSLRLLTRAGERLAEAIEGALRQGDALVGELELPGVLGRDNPGFDAIVGNPPFAGKNTRMAAHGAAYLARLQARHEGMHGNADLCAHFFRRAFGLLRRGGTLGLLATNTIAQGDTRAAGLGWICRNGGVIYRATRRLRWPGSAAVAVSVVHLQREPARPLQAVLDGAPVARISAFLSHRGGDEGPAPLPENAGAAFIGSYVLGMGFTFDDGAAAATPLAEMRRLIARDPRNGERILPYLGGKELNSSPTHAHHRYVIDFGQRTEEEARAWPDLLAIVEAKVRPQRARLGDNADGRRRKRCWWQWGRYTPALFEAMRGLDRVLVTARVSEHLSFARVPARQVFSEQLVVFALPGAGAFAVLQSRVHEAWARAFASSLEDRLRYTPSDCFEPFPFPAGWREDRRIEAIGKAYDRRRAALLVARGEGLTALYNRFHDPGERDPGVLELRALHAEMDRAVLDAYGFADLAPACEFSREPGRPARLRWPDAARDEVLTRLLEVHAAAAAAAAAAARALPRNATDSSREIPRAAPAGAL